MYTATVKVPIIDQAKLDALEALAPGLQSLVTIPLTVKVKDAVKVAHAKLTAELAHPDRGYEYIGEFICASTPNHERGFWVIQFKVFGD